MVPSGISPRTRNVADACSESGAESEDSGGEEQDCYLCAEATLAEFIDVLGLFGKDDTEEDERDGEECCDCEISRPNKLDVTVDPSCVVGQGVKALHGAGNEGDQHNDDRSVIHLESHRQRFRPSPVWMRSSHDSLCKDEVDDEEEEDACCDEDLCSDSDGYVSRMCAPD